MTPTTKTRTQRHRADERKASGIHYTPPELADLLARLALEALGTTPQRVLDPACGGGELLEAVMRSLDLGSQVAPTMIGFDTDSAAVAACSDRLQAFADVEVHHQDFLDLFGSSQTLFDTQESGRASFLGDAIDIAIANPPYVRTQTLGQERATDLARSYGIQGRVDLYMAFAFAMTQALRPGGVLALLCSNRFLTTKGGASMRSLLSSEYNISTVLDLGDTKLFQAAVLPAIVIATKKPSPAGATRFLSIYEEREASAKKVFASVAHAVESKTSGLAQIGDRTFRVRRGVLSAELQHGDAWNLQDEETRDLARRLAATAHETIGSLTKIRVGIKTTADSVFIRRDWNDLVESQQPEQQLLRPLLTHHVARRWLARDPEAQILYPHIDNNGRACPVELAAYPKAAAYLDAHRERLEGRKYVIEGGRRWYEIWVPQKPHLWPSPKVVFPDIAEEPRFFVDTTGNLVNGDCYWAATNTVDEALLIAAVGNSQLARTYYDALCGNQLYAGRRRYMTQYVEKFPVPMPGSAAADKIVALARDLHRGVADPSVAEPEIDAVLWDSFSAR